MPTRRTVLGGIAVSTASLAGCVGGDGGDGADGDDGGDGDDEPGAGEDTTTAEPTDGDAATTDGPADGDDTTTEGPAGEDDATTAGGDGSGATVTVAETDLGEVLADSEGVTLYLFTQDADGESVCYDDCAENWPPLVVDGEPTAGDGVSADLSTHERDDGATQVVANGWPLYYFAGDSAPGETNGQGVGDVWYVLAPDGSQMGESGATTTTTENGGGGSRY